MPNAGFVNHLQDVWGLATTVSTGGSNAVTLPHGFDAVAQCDQQLLNAQLVRNLNAAGLGTLRAKIPYNSDGLPPELVAAIGAHLTITDTIMAGEIALELRLTNPWLRTVGRSPEQDSNISTSATSGVMLAARFPIDSAPAEVVWTLELNLLRVEPNQVLARRSSSSSSPPSPSLSPSARVLGDFRFADVFELSDTQPAPSNSREHRTLLAAGQAVTRIPTQLVSHAELLRAWLELDTARAATVATSDDALLTAFLPTQRGQDLLRTALWPLTARGSVRVSPQIALAGVLAQQYVATMGLAAMQVRYKVHAVPGGREVLSLAFTFGHDAGGALSTLQPFIGQRNFAYYVARNVLSAVTRARWTLRPADHEFVGEGQVTMPLHEGTDQTGQGTVRVRVRLGGQLTDVGIMAAMSAQGDVLRLGCDQEVQVLAAWYANGDPVEDLGELGQPATLPFVVNIAPFTPAPAAEAVDTPFRDFLLTVLEPLAIPMVERFRIKSLDGFVSEALGSSAAWWSMPSPKDDVTAGVSTTDTAVAFG